MVNDACDSSDQCIEGLTCGTTSHKCEGFAEGHACEFHEECASQLYCSEETDKCTPTKAIGSSCSSSSECSSSESTFGAMCVAGKCVLPYSKKEGEPCLGNIECMATGLFCNTTCQPIPHTAQNGGEIHCSSDLDCANSGLQCICNAEQRAVCSSSEFPSFTPSKRLQKSINLLRECAEENNCRNGMSNLVPSTCMTQHCSFIHNCYLAISLDANGFPATCFAPQQLITECENYIDSIHDDEVDSGSSSSSYQSQYSSSESETDSSSAGSMLQFRDTILWAILLVFLAA